MLTDKYDKNKQKKKHVFEQKTQHSINIAKDIDLLKKRYRTIITSALIRNKVDESYFDDPIEISKTN